MLKIVMINHTFQQEQFSKRWKVLAKEHPDWDITLISPAEYMWGASKTLTFGTVEKKMGYEYNNQNYHVHPVNIKPDTKYGITWTSCEMISYIDSLQPDVVYHIGSHSQESLIQILDYKRKKNPNLIVYAFSMRGPVQDISNIDNLKREDRSAVKKMFRSIQKIYFKQKLKKLNTYCDAIFCHYPDAMQSFRKEGFKGPIFMQTQVGVDIDVFYPDEEKRNKIRSKYELGDAFVFASAVRFQPAKGTIQVLEALPKEGNWKYLLMGSGNPEEVQAVKDKILERGIEDKVILTGFVKWVDMAEYWNAADCCIHFPQSTTRWVETFSLSLVQAMATGLPVIGSSSGSVPYQIGPNGIIVDEKDIEELRNKITWVMSNPADSKEIGRQMYSRAVDSFSTRHLNELFYQTVNKLMAGIYDKNLIDMSDCKIE